MSRPSRPDLPSIDQSRALAGWLASPRGRLLRRVHIGRRARVLEVGCGHCVVTEELVRRAAGTVTCIDLVIEPALAAAPSDARVVAADARHLPFAGATFDVIFCQNVLMWVPQVETVIAEAARTLEPGGALVAIEPDYGGMMEYPPEIAVRDLWLAGLTRAGADPEVGRALPAICEAAGLDVWVELQGVPQPATAEATRLLLDLPLSADERSRALRAAEAIAAQRSKWECFVHVPYVLVVATKA
jgi:SAM-dependent methyltransferase